MLEIISTTPVNQENEGKRRFTAEKRGVAKIAARFARPQHLSSHISRYAPERYDIICFTNNDSAFRELLT